MINISCYTWAASIQKYEETSPIRIKINHGNFIYCRSTMGWPFMSLFNPSLSLGGKTMRLYGQPVVKQ